MSERIPPTIAFDEPSAEELMMFEAVEAEAPEGVIATLSEDSQEKTSVSYGKRQKSLTFKLPEDYTFTPEGPFDRRLNPNLAIPVVRVIPVGDVNGIDRAEEQSFQEFMGYCRQFPLLTRELEQVIFTFRDEGRPLSELKADLKFLWEFRKADPHAVKNLLSSSTTYLDLVANSNMRLVSKVASKYKGTLPLTELVAEGSIGLMKGFEKFDVNRGFKFSTYATWWIRQSMTRAAEEQGRLIRLPVHATQQAKTVNRLISGFIDEYGREPKLHELLKLGEVNDMNRVTILTLVESMINGTMGQNVSLDQPVGENDSSLGDFIPDEKQNAQTIFDEIDASIEAKVLKDEMKRLLSDKECDIIDRRIGLSDDITQTLEQVGREYGVTRERIRQIEQKALKKLGTSKELKKVYEVENGKPLNQLTAGVEETLGSAN